MSGAERPRVSALILNWNGGDDLLRAVASLERQSLGRPEIVVVDNGSSDGSCERLERQHPGLRLLRLGHNQGYCAGNNRGLELTNGDWVLLLNCDARVAEDFLERALEAVAGRPRVGLIAPRVLREDGRRLDTAGQFLSATRRVIDRGYDEPERGQYQQLEEVPGVCTAVALVRRELIDELAPTGRLFDERFFAFSEDADLCWRARRTGWRTLYVPGARAWHRRSASAGARRGLGRHFLMLSRGDQLAVHILKNRYLMILKNDSRLWLRLPLCLAADLPRLLALAVLRPRVLAGALRAWPLYREALRERRAASG